MDYKRVYGELIERGVKRGWTKKSASCYTEEHHILPKSIGGGDERENRVELTAREHYIAHWLLYKIHRNQKMACAWNATTMDRDGARKLTSRQFERARIVANENMKGENHPLFGKKLSEERKKAIGDFHRGKKMSDETRRKMSKSTVGFKHTEESKKKMGDAQRGKKMSQESKLKLSLSKLGSKASDEAKKKMSERSKRIVNAIVECPFCKKEAKNSPTFRKYHFKNCNMNPNCNDEIYKKYGNPITEKMGMVLSLLDKGETRKWNIISKAKTSEATYKRAKRIFKEVNGIK